MNFSNASLVPFVSEWDNDKALRYLLERGPHCVDPNLPIRYRDFTNGWYDDNRHYAVE